ncbi:MAG: benzoyl-CoA reductase subunit C [Woeseia sp.]
MSLQEIVDYCRDLYEDLEFTSVREWKAAGRGRRAIGHMPVYVPREIIHAAGMLPVGVLGGGEALDVIHGDAHYQSYICRIPRSTIELAVTGRLDCLDGMLFPSTCDVIRNLSGMWQLKFPDKLIRYFDVPQNFDLGVGGVFYTRELQLLRDDLGRLGGREVTDAALRESIALYNENRRAIGEIYAYRSAQPWQVPTPELYLLMRAGMVLPVEEHTRLIRDYHDAAKQTERPVRDNCRVVITGLFCEQPPFGLLKSIEMAGCYVVDDDFMLVARWLLEDVPTQGDPLKNLSDAFISYSCETSCKYTPDKKDKGEFLIESVRRNRAEGVIFASPSFCDPALLDRPMLQKALNARGIPYTAFKFAENSGQLQPIREQAGTFADSIKLWSAA